MHHTTIVARLARAGFEVDEIETRNGWTEYWCRALGGDVLSWQAVEGEPHRPIRHLNHLTRGRNGFGFMWWQERTDLTCPEFVTRFVQIIQQRQNPNER